MGEWVLLVWMCQQLATTCPGSMIAVPMTFTSRQECIDAGKAMRAQFTMASMQHFITYVCVSRQPLAHPDLN